MEQMSSLNAKIKIRQYKNGINQGSEVWKI